MEKKLQRQIDWQFSGLHVREDADGKKSRTIEGHAVVFGVRSVNLTPWSSYREVYEVMERGCISTELLNRSDIVLTAFHDNTAILGRWRQGKGTLNLSFDERGLKMSCTLAETTRADELLSAIDRGDISGMSFAFTADEEDSENGVSYERMDSEPTGKQVWIRHVKKVTALYDVTIAGHPAYTQTDVSRREIDEFLDAKIGHTETEEERQRREAEAREKAEREEQEKREREEREMRQRMQQEIRRASRRHINERDFDNDMFY